MIRRLITLLVLIGLVYMGYRIVDPVGAQALLLRVQSRFSSDEPITPIVVAPTPTTVVISTGIQADTGLVNTGNIPPSVVLEEEKPVSPSTGTSTPSNPPASRPPVQSQPRPTNSSSLSDQDMKDLQRLLNAIVE